MTRGLLVISHEFCSTLLSRWRPALQLGIWPSFDILYIPNRCWAAPSCILDGPTQVSAWKLSWLGSYRQYSPITNTQQQPTRCSHITEHAHGLRNLLNGNQLEFLNVRKWKRMDLCLVAVLVLPPFIKPSGTELIILIGRDAMAGLQSVKIINSSIYHCDVLYTILLCTQYNTKWSHCLKRSRYLRTQF